MQGFNVVPVQAVIGTQFGDEGKGKIVAWLSAWVDYIIRFQGGDNAGHTVQQNGNTYKFRLLPSGILSGNHCVLAGGMVINPLTLIEEINSLRHADGDLLTRLHVSRHAHMILPYHRDQDAYSEESKSSGKQIGTTRRGIGPAYEDKYSRNGLRMGDMLKSNFREMVFEIVRRKNILFREYYQRDEVDADEIWARIAPTIEVLAPLIQDTVRITRKALNSGARILMEGAQGTMLDIDYGSYPCVTSSHTVSGGIFLGTGISFSEVGPVIGVAKAYTTRVGEGPFPTEQDNEIGEMLRQNGGEFGTVTNRPRRCGWFDLPMARFACAISGVKQMAITKVDVLDGLDQIPICVGYRYGNDPKLETWPDIDRMGEAMPEYVYLPGWKTSTRECRSYEDFPPQLYAYIGFIQAQTGIPVNIVSVGPDTAETAVRTFV